ncbi:MAG: cobaltochelatase subunit CobT [Rhodobacteraceae bacterium]|nr:cobaltochelatase subunit CobT [Paracoccaceae bacterium]
MSQDATSEVDSFKKALADTTRSIAGDGELTIRFTNEAPSRNGDDIRLPQITPRSSAQDRAVSRGVADALALHIRHNDDATFVKYMPSGAIARDIYTAMEHARCEALGARAMAGVAANLQARMADYVQRRGYGDITMAADAPLADAVGFLIHKLTTGNALPEQAEHMLDLRLGDIMDRARTTLDDLDVTCSQVDFARYARRLISELGYHDQLGSDPDEANPEPEDDEDVEEQTGRDEADSDDGDAGVDDEACGRQMDDPEESTIPLDDLGIDEAVVEDAPNPDSSPDPEIRQASPSEADPEYRVYSSEFDETVPAEDLADHNELERLRAMLDQQLEPYRGSAGRLANKLQRRLLAQQNRSWEFDKEEGILDAGRLTRIITNPTVPLSFKVERDIEFRDTVVSLLLDNSGSMRGRPISIAAISADILARTLERCQVKVEILGFTTRMWKGGDSRNQWANCDRTMAPGRLNDLRHIIYKNADTPWRRTRINLGLMMKDGLLKENIDGEALEWAHSRLVMRQESRKILMVISDGAPVDDSTLSVNAPNYLENHLHNVIRMINNRAQVELLAIGIGHNVAAYYSRAVTISDPDQLTGVMTGQLAELFGTSLPASRTLAGSRSY